MSMMNHFIITFQFGWLREKTRLGRGYMSVCLSVCLSIYLSVCRLVCLSVCVSVCLLFYPSVCPSDCLSLFMSVRLSSPITPALVCIQDACDASNELPPVATSHTVSTLAAFCFVPLFYCVLTHLSSCRSLCRLL
jgi:hypothetical protein